MPAELFQPPSAYSGIRKSLSQLCQTDPRPWLVGFSGGKDSTLVAPLVFEAALACPPAQRTKEFQAVCADVRVEMLAAALKTSLCPFGPMLGSN